MIIDQIIEIPADRHVTLPPDVPTGPARLILQFPDRGTLPEEARGQNKHPAFRAALRQAQGAWADKPWEDSVAAVRALREEWTHRDPWNPDPAQQHRR
ncbi:MAG: hypothetical protein LBU00_00430 [Treponema sp.]|jgi:hypothetical protein|nr:hypothetical protein [Treponema sp.]